MKVINALQLFSFAQTDQKSLIDVKQNKESSEESSSFDQLLEKILKVHDMDFLEAIHTLEHLQDFPSGLQFMHLLLKDVEHESMDDKTQGQTLHNFLGNVKLPNINDCKAIEMEENILSFDGVLKDPSIIEILENLPKDIFGDLPKDIPFELAMLVVELNDISIQLEEKMDLNKLSSRVLHLLDRWIQLPEKVQKLFQEQLQDTELKHSQMRSIWEQLTKVYERRHSMNQLNVYSYETEVDTKQITKWLRHALQNARAETNQKTNILTSMSNPSGPMSRIEQYVIYLQRNGNSQGVNIDQQLIDQFTQIMKSNRFISMNNGINQMIFQLKPEQLGEMIVRLVEINGEMTVKITVTSETTKNILQSNLHQLNNIFSPHQVLIEKQDDLLAQQILTDQDNYEDESKNKDQSFDEQEEDEKDREKEDEEKSFQFILNEKV